MQKVVFDTNIYISAFITPEPDNRILECAVEAQEDVIVTGDKHLLKLKKYKGINIITLAEFLEINNR